MYLPLQMVETIPSRKMTAGRWITSTAPTAHGCQSLRAPQLRLPHRASFPALLKTTPASVPPLNLYDATAADLHPIPPRPISPFDAIRPDPEIFVPETAKDPADPNPSPRMDDPPVLREQHSQK